MKLRIAVAALAAVFMAGTSAAQASTARYDSWAAQASNTWLRVSHDRWVLSASGYTTLRRGECRAASPDFCMRRTHAGKCLTATSGFRIVLRRCAGSAGQEWRIVRHDHDGLLDYFWTSLLDNSTAACGRGEYMLTERGTGRQLGYACSQASGTPRLSQLFYVSS